MEKLTPMQWKSFHNARLCHICEKTFGREEKRVRDHDHLTGKYRGPAHSSCNLQYRIDPNKKKIPCIIHNFKNYDAHLILSAVESRHGRVTCIPSTNEKYISFTIGDITFIDSCQFMLSSLDKLASNLTIFPEVNKYVENELYTEHIHDEEPAEILSTLPTDNHITIDESVSTMVEEERIEIDYRDQPYTFQQISEEDKKIVNERMQPMCRKEVYPYEYFDDWQRFDETSLPTKQNFYSSLTNKEVSEEDYQHALNIFKKMNMSSLREYHDFYLLCDVLLLADVFETFRNTCMENYALDPAHFYTAPGLSWQAALKMSNITMDLLTDIDQHLFFEDGIRGGISIVTHRYAKANHPDIPDYDDTKPIEHLICWDANNLYGWAMSQYLPTGGFEWLTEKQIQEFDLESIKLDDDIGYVLEVDLGIPLFTY